MAHTYDTTSNEHQALSLTVRTPTSSVADHTVWEKHSNKTSDCLMVVSGVHHLFDLNIAVPLPAGVAKG